MTMREQKPIIHICFTKYFHYSHIQNEKTLHLLVLLIPGESSETEIQWFRSQCCSLKVTQWLIQFQAAASLIIQGSSLLTPQ